MVKCISILWIFACMLYENQFSWISFYKYLIYPHQILSYVASSWIHWAYQDSWNLLPQNGYHLSWFFCTDEQSYETGPSWWHWDISDRWIHRRLQSPLSAYQYFSERESLLKPDLTQVLLKRNAQNLFDEMRQPWRTDLRNISKVS